MPTLLIVEITGAVRVLFVNCSEPDKVASVPVAEGKEIVCPPGDTIEAISGAIRVLFVNVSVVALPTNVSVA